MPEQFSITTELAMVYATREPDPDARNKVTDAVNHTIDCHAVNHTIDCHREAVLKEVNLNQGRPLQLCTVPGPINEAEKQQIEDKFARGETFGPEWPLSQYPLGDYLHVPPRMIAFDARKRAWGVTNDGRCFLAMLVESDDGRRTVQIVHQRYINGNRWECTSEGMGKCGPVPLHEFAAVWNGGSYLEQTYANMGSVCDGRGTAIWKVAT